MTESKLDIAIVGAGIAGLTLSAALRKFGIGATIYEQAPAFARVGSGIQLTPNGIKVLRGLGLEGWIRAVSFAPEVGYNREWDSGEITYLHPMGATIETRFGAPDLSMHRADLHAALASLTPAADIRFGRKLVGIERAGDRIELRFGDGGRVTADAVIGADGMHSVVRRVLAGEEKPHFTGQVAYRAVYRSSLLGRPIDDRVKWWGAGRHIVTNKIDPRRDELYFIASTPEPDFEIESWSALGDRDMLIEAYAGFHPDALLILERAPEVRKWALVEREPLPRWTAERCIVIGDAAHPMLPYMAQGACSAMEDAVLLARCLRDVSADDVDDAFRRCEASRRERTVRIQRGAKENTWMRTAASTRTDWVYAYDAWSEPLL